MKFAFSSNAYRNFSIEDTIDSIHDAGYSGIEIMCDIPHAFPPLTNEKINSIKKTLDKNMMTISNLNGFMMNAIEDFHHPSWIEKSQEYRNKRIEHTKNCITLASILNAKTVSTEPGGPKTWKNPTKELDIFEDGLHDILPLTEELKINLLIEPEPNLSIENSSQFLKFIERFDSKYLGLNFDIGHFFCVNENPAKLIHELNPYIKHIHLEDIASTREHYHLIPGHGVIDFKSIFQSLKDIKYNGFITVELYPYDKKPKEAAIESLQFLNSILKDV